MGYQVQEQDKSGVWAKEENCVSLERANVYWFFKDQTYKSAFRIINYVTGEVLQPSHKSILTPNEEVRGRPHGQKQE